MEQVTRNSYQTAGAVWKFADTRSNTQQEDNHPQRFDILTPRGAAGYLGGILSEAALSEVPERRRRSKIQDREAPGRLPRLRFAGMARCPGGTIPGRCSRPRTGRVSTVSTVSAL
jgi:hypothetical protein